MSCLRRGCGASGEGLKESGRLEACKQCEDMDCGFCQAGCFLGRLVCIKTLLKLGL